MKKIILTLGSAVVLFGAGVSLSAPTAEAGVPNGECIQQRVCDANGHCYVTCIYL